jgi:hypothetical protein
MRNDKKNQQRVQYLGPRDPRLRSGIDQSGVGANGLTNASSPISLDRATRIPARRLLPHARDRDAWRGSAAAALAVAAGWKCRSAMAFGIRGVGNADGKEVGIAELVTHSGHEQQ